jgi:hypothetical protein
VAVTLAIGVVVSDGVVVAADSRTSQKLAGDNTPFRVLSDFTHKVFRVGTVAVATHGYAILLGRNIAGHVSEFSAQFKGEDTARAVAEGLSTFFEKRFAEHVAEFPADKPAPGNTALGFLVGGFDAGVGCLHEVSVPDGEVTKLGDSSTGTAAWRGQTDVIIRLVKGVDLDQLNRHAVDAGLTEHLEGLGPVWSKMEYVIQFNVMNVQDAVDFAVLAIRTTIDVQRLTHGTRGAPGSWPGVGGPIEVATVTAEAGFQWLQQTQLQAERPSGIADR